jgi:hypothetical protein
MNSEPKLAECLRQYAELLCDGITDKSVKEVVMSALVYGFMFREEVAAATPKIEDNTEEEEASQE